MIYFHFGSFSRIICTSLIVSFESNSSLPFFLVRVEIHKLCDACAALFIFNNSRSSSPLLSFEYLRFIVFPSHFSPLPLSLLLAHVHHRFTIQVWVRSLIMISRKEALGHRWSFFLYLFRLCSVHDASHAHSFHTSYGCRLWNIALLDKNRHYQ